MDGSTSISPSDPPLPDCPHGGRIGPIDVRRNPAVGADSPMIGGALRRVAVAYGRSTMPLDRGTCGGA
jgi:hypothetical protein